MWRSQTLTTCKILGTLLQHPSPLHSLACNLGSNGFGFSIGYDRLQKLRDWRLRKQLLNWEHRVVLDSLVLLADN